MVMVIDDDPPRMQFDRAWAVVGDEIQSSMAHTSQGEVVVAFNELVRSASKDKQSSKTILLSHGGCVLSRCASCCFMLPHVALVCFIPASASL